MATRHRFSRLVRPYIIYYEQSVVYAKYNVVYRSLNGSIVLVVFATTTTDVIIVIIGGGGVWEPKQVFGDGRRRLNKNEKTPKNN